MIFLALFMMFGAATAFVLGLVPIVVRRGGAMAQSSSAKFALKYDAVLSDEQIKKTQRLMLGLPVFLALLAALFAPTDLRLAAVLGGAAIGFFASRIYLSGLISARKRKFNDQLMDALMIMSSSFRGGLSLIQAIEAVVDEMSDPLKQEFGIVLGENKMGVALDESLNRLYKRMPSAGLQQMIVAILLARETGGNLALIFGRIIGSMRERKKIEQNLQVLTVQGKIQAVVMTGLPILFYLGISASNPHFFDVMQKSPTGHTMLLTCAILWTVGALSIWKISTFKES